jgi:sugar lactone lactonase YvrE
MGQLATPRGLAVDKDGTVYVMDTMNHRVQKFRF